MAKSIDPVTVLRAFVARYDTRQAAARDMGVSSVYLGDLLGGRRKFSDRILAKLKLRRVVESAERA